MSQEKKKAKAKKTGGRERPFSTLSDEISKKILREVVADVHPPGSKLPTERALAEQYGVARQVVRESLKYLQALGVLTIRKRVGIVVNDLPITCFYEHFELFLFREDGSVDIDCLKEILQFRNHINEHVLREAARNRTEEDLDEIRSLVQAYRECGDDQNQMINIMGRYMKAMAKASHNRMYRMLANTGANVLLKLQLLILKTDVLNHESDETMEQLLVALEKKDDEIAVILGTRRLKQFDQMIIDRITKEPAGWSEVA
ncbi:MAG: FadR family transcriptional regulator [Proteobacteria bacterium]|nr:FadR family transcriptional regulator [Pseudomonadota bacterium]